MLQPSQASHAGVVGPAKRHVVHEEHPLHVAGEGLHLQPAQAAERVREADLLELAGGGARCQVRAWRDGCVLRVSRNLSLGCWAPSVACEDHGAAIGAVAAEESTVSIEPESGH